MSVAAPDLVAPAYLWVPERTSSAGDEAVDLAATVGWEADPEQRLMLDVMLSENGDRWAAFETAIIEPRQNGKTDSGQVAGLYDLFIRRVGRVVWTAHKYKTTQDTFEWFAAVCENYDHLRKRVYKIQMASGEQSIRLLPRHSGPRMDFLARASGGGRGLDGDVVNLDEALYLTPMMMGALLPVMSAKPDPQVRYFSSAGILMSAVLRSIRDRGRALNDPSLAYAEWAATRRPCGLGDACMHTLDSPDCWLDDERAHDEANPTRGRRITPEYTRNERRALTPMEFMRERLGVWEDPPNVDGAADNGMPGWDAALTDRGAQAPFTLGLEVSADSRSAAVAIFGGGVAEVVDYRKGAGLGWVPGRVKELRAKYAAAVAVRSSSPTEQLRAQLGDDVTWLTAAEVVGACLGFATGINEGTVAHRDQASLSIAVGAADRKFAGEVWRWSLSGSWATRGVDISPLLACAWAVHIADNVDRSTEALLSSFG